MMSTSMIASKILLAATLNTCRDTVAPRNEAKSADAVDGMCLIRGADSISCEVNNIMRKNALSILKHPHCREFE